MSSGRSHLLSAVVGRRNNWFLSPWKLPEQFLIKSTRTHSYQGGGAAVEEWGVKRKKRKKEEAESGRWYSKFRNTVGKRGGGNLASHVTKGGGRGLNTNHTQ